MIYSLENKACPKVQKYDFIGFENGDDFLCADVVNVAMWHSGDRRICPMKIGGARKLWKSLTAKGFKRTL
tara:strand:+ start:251 stop:460 length:210 start_codon:yes stop_codon:yes gene_type:complete